METWVADERQRGDRKSKVTSVAIHTISPNNLEANLNQGCTEESQRDAHRAAILRASSTVARHSVPATMLVTPRFRKLRGL